MRKMRISKWAVLTAAWLSCLLFLPLQAADLQESGSLTIALHEGDKAVGGGELTIWKAGVISETENGPVFQLSDAFAQSRIPLTNLENQNVIDALCSYAKTHSIAGMVRTVPENGTVRLDPLAAGLYLVVQTKTPEGYETMQPFLISVPVLDAVDNTWTYDVNACPKAEVESSSGTRPNTTPNTPSTSTNNTNTGVEYFWMEYAGLWLIAMILLFLYFAGNRKKRTY